MGHSANCAKIFPGWGEAKGWCDQHIVYSRVESGGWRLAMDWCQAYLFFLPVPPRSETPSCWPLLPSVMRKRRGWCCCCRVGTQDMEQVQLPTALPSPVYNRASGRAPWCVSAGCRDAQRATGSSALSSMVEYYNIQTKYLLTLHRFTTTPSKEKTTVPRISESESCLLLQLHYVPSN